MAQKTSYDKKLKMQIRLGATESDWTWEGSWNAGFEDLGWLDGWMAGWLDWMAGWMDLMDLAVRDGPKGVNVAPRKCGGALQSALFRDLLSPWHDPKSHSIF